MPPRKKTAAAPPLTDIDVKDLAFRVKGGDTPRVIVRSASAAVPAGTRGNVIRIGNPKDGEYIVVRLGRDEVPFAPSELSLSTRGRPAKAAPAKATPAKTAPASTAAAAPKKTAAAASRPARTSARSAPRSVATKSSSGARSAAKRTSSSGSVRTATSAGKRSTRRSKSVRSPQPLTVTLRFADSRWTVEAQRGSRRLAKAMPLRPGAVSAFAEHVDEEAVRAALVETVESCRAVVEEQAATLRAELQAAEQALREYDARRR